MVRRVFFSFHFANDFWRASQIRQAGVLEGDEPVTDNEWSTITRGGDRAIENWINNQMARSSCCVVLIGSETAGRKWINYEIRQAWITNKGVLGIHIYKLKDQYQKQSPKGGNPFHFVTSENGTSLSKIVRVMDPPQFQSEFVYAYIKESIASWVEEAIQIRQYY